MVCAERSAQQTDRNTKKTIRFSFFMGPGIQNEDKSSYFEVKAQSTPEGWGGKEGRFSQYGSCRPFQTISLNAGNRTSVYGIITTFELMTTESKRQQRFARMIQKDLGDIFQRDMPNLLPNVMVTVTTVRATPDLSAVRVYLSFFNAPDAKEAINTIKLQANDIRYKLGKRIRNQVRVVP